MPWILTSSSSTSFICSHYLSYDFTVTDSFLWVLPIIAGQTICTKVNSHQLVAVEMQTSDIRADIYNNKLFITYHWNKIPKTSHLLLLFLRKAEFLASNLQNLSRSYNTDFSLFLVLSCIVLLWGYCPTTDVENVFSPRGHLMYYIIDSRLFWDYWTYVNCISKSPVPRTKRMKYVFF